MTLDPARIIGTVLPLIGGIAMLIFIILTLLGGRKP